MANYLDENGLLYFKTKLEKLLDTLLADKVDKVDGKGLSTKDFTAALLEKLNGITAGAEPNVNADWNAVTGDAMILNKPNLSTVATSGNYADLNNKPTLSTVAASGSYNDLSNKPTIPTTVAALSDAGDYAKKSELTGMYKYKGSKVAYDALPTTGNSTGDVWNVEADGMNYAWDGTAWDSLGSLFSISSITNAQIDAIFV